MSNRKKLQEDDLAKNETNLHQQQCLADWNNFIDTHDRTSYGRVYKVFKEMLMTIIYARIKDKCRVEDITHDIFIQMMEKRNLPKIDNYAALENYWAKVAIHKCYDEYRRNKRKEEKMEIVEWSDDYDAATEPRIVAGLDLEVLEKTFIKCLPSNQWELVKAMRLGMTDAAIDEAWSKKEGYARKLRYVLRKNVQKIIGMFGSLSGWYS
ncbi:MAG: hypothetical protein AAF587_08925 [Bacteroidota bacterium]